MHDQLVLHFQGASKTKESALFLRKVISTNLDDNDDEFLTPMGNQPKAGPMRTNSMLHEESFK